MLPPLCGTVRGCPVKDSYPWYAPFLNATLELDCSVVARRIDVARRAIDQRIDELEQKGQLLSADERQAIDDALSQLRVAERGAMGRVKMAS
jgi:hypothetical protein